jgi:hypothetical protein
LLCARIRIPDDAELFQTVSDAVNRGAAIGVPGIVSFSQSISRRQPVSGAKTLLSNDDLAT